jgi:endonuclease YncB( thermonuclease family)
VGSLGRPFCAFISRKLTFKKAVVESLPCNQVERDRYGRSVSICYAGGDDLSALMVSAGMALAFLRYSAQYQDAERRAANRARGLHAHNCIPPWEWRAQQRQ